MTVGAMKRIFALFILIAGIGFALPLCVRAQQAAQQAGEVSFKLKGVDGKDYDVAEMRGNVLLVSFGASWCQPCWTELRALEELKQEFKDRPVKFFWISIERNEEISDDKLRSFAKAKNLTFPVLRDPSGFLYAQFSLRRRIPLVIFINQKGELVAPQHTGMAEPELYKRTMRERINKLLQTTGTAATTATK
jgi:peroxiredoxin